MRRRDFLASGLAGGAGMAVSLASPSASANSSANSLGRFRLNYAPHFGTFRNLAGDDPADQIHFMADEGFRTLEDVGLRFRPKAWQRQIQREVDRRGLAIGAFEATADFRQATFAAGRRDLSDMVLRELRLALDVAERMNARWISIVPGKSDRSLSQQQQTTNAIELLHRCAELCEKRNRVLLLEPLLHPEMFLRTSAQAAQICRAVNSPACRVLFDIGERPVSTAHLVADIEQSWDEIGYFRLGDFPGRKEPGTGQIDFRTIFQLVSAKGFDGVLGMDHGNMWPGESGELRVLEAYLTHDIA